MGHAEARDASLEEEVDNDQEAVEGMASEGFDEVGGKQDGYRVAERSMADSGIAYVEDMHAGVAGTAVAIRAVAAGKEDMLHMAAEVVELESLGLGLMLKIFSGLNIGPLVGAYDAACLVEAAARALAAHVDLACTHEVVEGVQILGVEVKEEAGSDETRPETDSSWEVEAVDLVQLMDERTLGQASAVKVYLEEGCLVQSGVCHRLLTMDDCHPGPATFPPILALSTLVSHRAAR